MRWEREEADKAVGADWLLWDLEYDQPMELGGEDDRGDAEDERGE